MRRPQPIDVYAEAINLETLIDISVMPKIVGLVVLDAAGTLVTPDPRRGGVRSIALEILGEAIPELSQRDIPVEELRQAREVIAVNAVRGARRVKSLDDQEIGNPSENGVTAHLTQVLEGCVG